MGRARHLPPLCGNLECKVTPLTYLCVSDQWTGTFCGLDDPGIEFLWGEIFRTRSHWPSYTIGYRVSFPGIKRPGRHDHLSPSSAEVKERVGLYLYSPSGPSWPVTGRTLPFAFYKFDRSPTSWMCGAIPTLPLNAIVAWKGRTFTFLQVSTKLCVILGYTRILSEGTLK